MIITDYLHITPDGQPLLGCARPTCFGWAPDGKRATNTAYFERVNGYVSAMSNQRESQLMFSIPSHFHPKRKLSFSLVIIQREQEFGVAASASATLFRNQSSAFLQESWRIRSHRPRFHPALWPRGCSLLPPSDVGEWAYLVPFNVYFQLLNCEL